MNDPLLALEKIQELISTSRQLDPHFQPGFYAAAMNLIRELQEHVSEHRKDIPRSGYVLEKISDLHWHSGAMFGFDTDNGHGSDAHHAWAIGSIQNLKGLLNE